MEPNSINLAILDCNPLFGKILKSYLLEQKCINKVIQASDIYDLLEKCNDMQIDLLIVDPQAQNPNTDNIMGKIRGRNPEIKLLVLSSDANMYVSCSPRENNIYGYMSKADEPEELLEAIRTIAGNKIYRSRIFTEALYWSKEHNIRANMNKNLISLNEREIKMLQFIWEEKSSKEIADLLYLGVRSVEKIRQDLKEKLGVRSTVGLLKYAIDQGILDMKV
nr:response regulator transcription factor [uncultured Chitinophaga sp.]